MRSLKLRKRGNLDRVGGKRYGYWTIPDWLSSELKKVINYSENRPNKLKNRPNNRPNEFENRPNHQPNQSIKNKLVKEDVLFLLERNNFITISEMMKIMNVSNYSIKKALADLKNSGTITHVGSTKTGYWKINKQ